MLRFPCRAKSLRNCGPVSACLIVLLCMLQSLTGAQSRLNALLPALDPPTASTSSAKLPPDEWIAVYFGGKKVGYSGSHTTASTFQSQPALIEAGHGITRIQLLGTTVEEDETTETITDLNHHPLKQTFDIKSNGSSLHISALFDYSASKVYCTVGEGKGAQQKTLDIPKGAILTSDTTTLTEGQTLAVGKQFAFYYLEPVNVELRQAKISVTDKVLIKDDAGRLVPAFVFKSDLLGGKMTGWADSEGTMIKSEINLGVASLTMVSETKSHALDTQYISPVLTVSAVKSDVLPADFADATAIIPDRVIENPRRLVTLQATISDIPEHNLVPSDSRQKAERTKETDAASGVTANYTIHAERMRPEDASKWPVHNPDLAGYLTRAIYLDTDDAQIRDTALRLRGKETNLYKIAASIRNWVHSAMTPDASIGIPRSAKDVYTRRRGVCRDYATLYTALARAAGVPTRLCAGIVYAQGKFFYHAWAESYVGQWVAFDPTLYNPRDAEFVDATHIKFAQGDATQMFNVVSIVGRLKIHVEATESASLKESSSR